MSSEKSFLKAIHAAPDDDALRLVYADWLDERGDPRGEFIRIQVARAAGDDHRTLVLREHELRAAHGGDWAGPLRELVGDWQFHRGLLEEVMVNARTFLEKGETLFRLAPLQRVRLRGVEDVLPELACQPILAQVRGLDLVGERLDDLALHVLASSPHVGELRSLNLSLNLVGTSGIRALAESPHLGNLRELILTGNSDVADLGVQALCASKTLPALVVLDVTSCGLTDTAARALAGAPLLPRLRTLNLGGNRIGHGALRTLINSPKAAGLQTLGLDAAEINSLVVQAIGIAKHLTNLRRLHLRMNHITDGGADALVRAPHLTNLVEVDLRENPIGAEARQRLRERFGAGVSI